MLIYLAILNILNILNILDILYIYLYILYKYINKYYNGTNRRIKFSGYKQF
jgi:hypothetical protein